MIETKKLNLNGIKLEAGEITPRTRRFFESKGARIEDLGDKFRLTGGFSISKVETDVFLKQKDREDLLAILKSELQNYFSHLDQKTHSAHIFNAELSNFIREYPCQSLEAKIFLRLLEGSYLGGNRYNAMNIILRSHDFASLPEECRAQIKSKVLPLLKARYEKKVDDIKMANGILEILSGYDPKEFDTQCVRKLILCVDQNNSKTVKKVQQLLEEESPYMSHQKTRVSESLLEMIERHNERTNIAEGIVEVKVT